MKTVRRFREVRGGWLDKDSGHVFKTAMAARRAVQRESRRNARRGGGIGIVTVEWDTATELGARVVRAIGEVQ